MKKSVADRDTRFWLIIMLFFAAFLFLSNLGNHYLWQDEAQTALVSKTILTHGIPLGYDGKNYFSNELGAEYGKNYIWKWHTWLPFYATAASFLVFGINTFAARLPFALCGIATVILTYYFSKSLWKEKKVALLSSALLLLSVPFLILSRQCRYYSMATMFSLCGLYSYFNILEDKRYSSIAFFISLTLLFHVNHMYYATLTATTLLHVFLCRRDCIKKISVPVFWSILINIPWIIWFSRISYPGLYVSNITNIAHFFKLISSFLGDVEKYIFPKYILLIILAIFVYGRLKKGAFRNVNINTNGIFLLSIFLCVNLIALSATSPYPFFRYLAPLIPVFCIITALIIVLLTKIHYALGILFATILICLNPLPDYAYEITHDYSGPVKGIAKYLCKHGRDGDTVAVTYEDLPIKFYTKMKVFGGLTGEDLSGAENAKWIIMRKHDICSKDRAVRQYLLKNVRWSLYKKIMIDYADTYFENREDPSWHNYRTVLYGAKVIIYERI